MALALQVISDGFLNGLQRQLPLHHLHKQGRIGFRENHTPQS